MIEIPPASFESHPTVRWTSQHWIDCEPDSIHPNFYAHRERMYLD